MTKKPSINYAFGYIRVSTDDQLQALDAQVYAIQEYFQKEVGPKNPGVQWAKIVEDPGRSAFRIPFLKRPGGLALYNALKPGDHVIFAYFDRAFRNFRDAAFTYDLLVERGITCHFMDAPISGINDPHLQKLIISILAWVAEYESLTRSKRIKQGIESSKRRGTYFHFPRHKFWEKSNKNKEKIDDYRLHVLWEFMRLRKLGLSIYSATRLLIGEMSLRDGSAKPILADEYHHMGYKYSLNSLTGLYYRYLRQPALQEAVAQSMQRQQGPMFRARFNRKLITCKDKQRFDMDELRSKYQEVQDASVVTTDE